MLRHLVVPVLSIVLVVAACGSSTPSPGSASPSVAATSAPASASAGSPEPSKAAAAPTDRWQAADVAQPSPILSAPSLDPGYQCHPCHFLAENQFLGMGLGQAGPIAVGVLEPPAQAIAYQFTDGAGWVPVPGFADAVADGTAALAAASDGSRTVIVGHDQDGAMSWTSDGSTWQAAPRQDDLLVPYSAGGMTALTTLGPTFVAGGYHDDPLHDKASAAVWRSGDGTTWTADDGAGAFAGGRIWGIASRDGTIVAVGTTGDPIYGPAGAWRWTAADGWRRATIGPDGGGAMRAVAATATGFVAVGLAPNDTGGRSWTSPDGVTWTAAPDAPSMHYFELPVRMQTVAVGPTGLVAGGWRSDAGKGSAVIWSSTDGITWDQEPWQASFSGGQIDGIAVLGGQAMAAGRTGYPDWNRASIWSTTQP